MADMLGGQDENYGQHRDDGLEVKLREMELGHREQARLLKRREVDDPDDYRGEISRDHRDKQRNDGEELSEQNGAEDRDAEGDCEDDRMGRGREIRAGGTGCYGVLRKFESDKRDDGSHRCRRQDDVNPVSPVFIEDPRQQTAHEAYDDKAALGVLEAFRRDDDGGRR